MVVDAVRTYLDAANGLTELSRKQAVAAAKSLLRANGSVTSAVGAGAAHGADGPPPRVGRNIQALAGELIEISQANRDAIIDLVRSEVGRALQQMDMVPRAEHERVVRRVAELERRLAARRVVEQVLTSRDGASSTLSGGRSVGEGEPREQADVKVRVARDETAGAEAADIEGVEGQSMVEGPGAEVIETGAVWRDRSMGGSSADAGSAESGSGAGGGTTTRSGARPKAGAGAAKSGGTGGTKAEGSAVKGSGAKTNRPRAAAKRTTKGKGAKK